MNVSHTKLGGEGLASNSLVSNFTIIFETLYIYKMFIDLEICALFSLINTLKSKAFSFIFACRC